VAFEQFEKDREGNIKSSPLAGWELVPVAGMALLARLSYFPDEAAMRSGKPEAVQLMMTPEQCRELSAVLLKMADHLSHRPNRPAS
jgi:hypothetical protein